MKKIISIVASVVMLVSMLTIGVSAAPAGYTVSSDLLPAIQAAGALTTTGNWLGVSVSTEGITKTDALAYDFTVEGSEANTGFKIQLDGYSVEAWNLTSMIAEKHGVTLAGDKLPVGTYTGVLDVSALPALANTNGIFGMTKATVTVREFAFVTGGTSGEGGGTTPPPAGGGEGEGNEGGEGSTPVTGEEIDLGIGNTYRDGWAAISEKTSGKVVDFTGKKVTLVYNFTLVDFLSLSIRNDVA